MRRLMMSIQLRTITLSAVLTAFSLSTGAATNIFNVTGGNGINYTINGAQDPALTLVRGMTYEFRITVAANHPFFIQTLAGIDYNDGVSGTQGETDGSIFFNVPTNAPNQLKYQCGIHAGMTGPLNIVDAPTVSITDFNVGTNVVIRSTGTNILNISVLTSTNLNSAWVPATVQSNLYASGTNTTHVALPTGNTAFFRVQQGFF